MTDVNTPVGVDEATLAEIVGFVWQTFTGEEGLEPNAAPPPGAVDGCRFATIAIGGTWTATLLVAMGPALVGQFASALMGAAPDELDQPDIDDAFGELANIVGGNVKGLIDDAAATLSLPVVAPARPSVTGGRLTAQVAYQVAGQPMVWELWERV
ncbi:MAG TPA: chemotaxis protein CheX [Ilumatobacter sp.]|nr:chemotaxis protein CheX [Ilumatobacter sp.]